MAKRKRRKRRPRAAGPQGPDPPAASPAQVASTTEETERVSTSSRKPRDDGPPPAPWGSFPLSEIVILISIVLLVAGFFVEAPRGPIMIGVGLVLGALAGLELAVREHFSGYRSHTTLLAGMVGVAVLAGSLVLTPITPWACLGAAAACFAVAAYLLATGFRRRSGGSLFRIKA